MEDLFSLEGRVALITGASRGIGEAIAAIFARKGAHCILASRKIEDLESVVAKIEQDGGKAQASACNVGDMDQIDTLVAMIKKEHGRLDILVNNAATNPYLGNMDGIDQPRWDKTFDVNLKGPFFLIQKTIDLLAASGKGSVINVSSISGVRPGPFQGVYSITKAAMISMTQGFAKELGLKNIRVNALLPGITETRFSSALFLASDASTYTTGTCLTCDGGYLA